MTRSLRRYPVGNTVLLMIFALLEDDAMQEVLAGPVADALVKALPDVSEDVLGKFLQRVGEKIVVANP